MVTYTNCPVCGSSNIRAFISANDHTVSGESFVIMACNDCTHLFTQDIPSAKDIGKYYASEDYISHSDTQEGLVNKLYHTVRKRTLNAKKILVQNATGKRSGQIADIGCGTGAFLNTMKHAGWNITGIEPDETARAKAASLYGIDPLPADEFYKLPAEKFDAITLWHVLEHVHELHAYITQLKNMLSARGKLFIAVPNYTSYDAKHYGAFWAAYDVPRHLYHFSPQSMRRLLQEHGLVAEKIKPMWFDSFYVSMLSEKYKNGKGNLVKAFFMGFISNLKTMMNKEKCSSLIYIISVKS